jgi:hypothetical protein
VTSTLVGDSGARGDLRTIIVKYYAIPLILSLRSIFSLLVRQWLRRVPCAFGPVIPVAPNRAHVAQLVEHFLGKEEVHRFKPGRGLHFLQSLSKQSRHSSSQS